MIENKLSKKKFREQILVERKKERYQLKFGTADLHNPSALFCNIQFYIKPNRDFEELIGEIRRRIRLVAFKNANAEIGNVKEMMTDYIYPASNVAIIRSKRAYMSIDITLFTRIDIPWVFDDELKGKIESFGTSIFEEIDKLENSVIG